jgi:hypothetical protein
MSDCDRYTFEQSHFTFSSIVHRVRVEIDRRVISLLWLMSVLLVMLVGGGDGESVFLNSIEYTLN